jgi:hypothetical protein
MRTSGSVAVTTARLDPTGLKAWKYTEVVINQTSTTAVLDIVSKSLLRDTYIQPEGP